MATTADRLKQIMSERGLRAADIIRLATPYCKEHNVKLSKSDLSQYLHEKSVPGQSKLSILGLALNVSEVWLMGADVPRERQNASTPRSENERMNEFVKLFNQLTDAEQNLVIAQIKGILTGR